MIAITSLSPNPARVAVQREAVASWRAAGLQVQSMNHPDDIFAMAQQFDVEFLPCFETAYGKYIPYNPIIAHMLTFPGQSVFVNSDIVFRLTPDQLAGFADACKDGLGYIVRHNHDGDEAAGVREPYGIDAWISDPRAVQWPKSFLSVGRPGGDYWFPAAYLAAGLPLYTTDDRIAMHRNHPQAWDIPLYFVGAGELCRLYNLSTGPTNGESLKACQDLHVRIDQATRVKVLP